MTMNILITGASGFIGGHVCQALYSAGHKLTLCLRSPGRFEQRWPAARFVVCDFSRMSRKEDWLPYLEGIDIVINCVGIIQQTGRQTFQQLHAAAPSALFQAAAQQKVKKVIQISALGADESAFSQYHLTKKAADDQLMQLDLDWIILQPSIVYGPGAKSMALFKTMAALPLIPLIGKGEQLVQPVYIDDLVETVIYGIESNRLNRTKINLVGPEAITLKNLYGKLRFWLGFGKARFIAMPFNFMLFIGRFAEKLGNSFISRESLLMLEKGSIADVAQFQQQLGHVPASLQQGLFDKPALQADRWHAMLSLLAPALRWSLGLLWIFTGLVSAFIYPAEQSYDMLARSGITGDWAILALYGAATVDFILGLALLLSWRVTLVAQIQIGLMLIYSVIISFSLPELWLHPFGPVTKNIPLIVATLVMMVLERK